MAKSLPTEFHIGEFDFISRDQSKLRCEDRI